MTTRGGCHCGGVRFEVDGAPDGVTDCNCSICTKKGFLHWIVPTATFRLLSPRENLALYQFNTKVAQHLFCRTCGIASFYIPRSDPDKVDVNARCLDDVDLERLRRIPFDGRNWEDAYARSRADRSDR